MAVKIDSRQLLSTSASIKDIVLGEVRHDDNNTLTVRGLEEHFRWRGIVLYKFLIFVMIPIPQITPQMQKGRFFLCLVWFLHKKATRIITEWWDDGITESQNNEPN